MPRPHLVAASTRVPVGRTTLTRQRRQLRAEVVRKSTWPVRLRFFIIGVVFAICWWFGSNAMQGRVSFSWAAALGSQIGTFTTSLRLPTRQPVTAAHAVTEQPPVLTAQGVPSPIAGIEAGTPSNGATTATPVAAVAIPTATADPATAVPTAGPVATRGARTQTDVANSARAKETAAVGETARAAATAEGDAGIAGPHTIYVVRDGDTLFGIARRYGLSLSELADYNHLLPPYRLIKGARVLIPAT